MNSNWSVGYSAILRDGAGKRVASGEYRQHSSREPLFYPQDPSILTPEQVAAVQSVEMGVGGRHVVSSIARYDSGSRPCYRIQTRLESNDSSSGFRSGMPYKASLIDDQDRVVVTGEFWYSIFGWPPTFYSRGAGLTAAQIQRVTSVRVENRHEILVGKLEPCADKPASCYEIVTEI